MCLICEHIKREIINLLFRRKADWIYRCVQFKGKIGLIFFTILYIQSFSVKNAILGGENENLFIQRLQRKSLKINEKLGGISIISEIDADR